MTTASRFVPPPRLLLGPGPSDVHRRVLEALAQPLVGHLDPAFLALMDELKRRLRAVFRTENELTFAVSGTGSAGMEACLVNLLEEGDEAVVMVNGEFGRRMTDIVARCRARPRPYEIPWGRAVEPADVEKALSQADRPKVVALVHAETSTGAQSPVEEIAPIVARSGALFVLDTVTSLGGCPVEVDAWKVDACYSGTQKCLSCPPGLAPVTFGARAPRSHPPPDEQGAELVSRRDDDREILGRGARLPPHRADLHELRPRRGVAPRRGGRARGTVRASSPQPPRAGGGARSTRLPLRGRAGPAVVDAEQRLPAASRRGTTRRRGCDADFSTSSASRSAAGSASSRGRSGESD